MAMAVGAGLKSLCDAHLSANASKLLVLPHPEREGKDCLDWALLADKYDLPRFWMACKQFIVKNSTVRTCDCYSILTLASLFSLSYLQRINVIRVVQLMPALFCPRVIQHEKMALLSINAMHQIFKTHLAGPAISVSGNLATFEMPSMTCCQYPGGCDGVVKVTVKAYYNTTRIVSHQCKKCGKRW